MPVAKYLMNIRCYHLTLSAQVETFDFCEKWGGLRQCERSEKGNSEEVKDILPIHEPHRCQSPNEKPIGMPNEVQLFPEH